MVKSKKPTKTPSYTVPPTRGGAFIDPTDKVAVTDEYGNTIWLRPRMDFGTERRLSVLFGELDSRRRNAMAYEHATLMCNIMDWDGPLFEVEDPTSNGRKKTRKMPYSDVMLQRLDPKNPQVKALVLKTLEMIETLNADPPAEDDQADPTPATSTE